MNRYDNVTGGFSSLGEFFVSARKATDGEIKDSRLVAAEGKTWTEGTDSGGGVLVPEAWANEIYHAALENSIVRSRAISHEMVRDIENIPVLVDSDRSASIFGGVTRSWLEEAGDKVASDTLPSAPALGNLKLQAHECVATTFVSNALEDDYENAPGKFQNFIKLAFGKAIRFYEDYDFIWGNGVGQPLGIMNSGHTISVTRTGLVAVNIADIGNMAARLFPGSWNTAVWLINQSVLAQWIEMQSVAANSVSGIDLSNMLCLGRPIIVTEKCSAMGTSGDIILADFANGYVIGDRALEVAGSKHVNYSKTLLAVVTTHGFLMNETFWKVVMRCDGQPIMSGAVTPMLGGSTLSHFVTLTTSS